MCVYTSERIKWNLTKTRGSVFFFGRTTKKRQEGKTQVQMPFNDSAGVSTAWYTFVRLFVAYIVFFSCTPLSTKEGTFTEIKKADASVYRYSIVDKYFFSCINIILIIYSFHFLQLVYVIIKIIDAFSNRRMKENPMRKMMCYSFSYRCNLHVDFVSFFSFIGAQLARTKQIFAALFNCCRTCN